MRYQVAILVAFASVAFTQSSSDAQGKFKGSGAGSGWLPSLQEGRLQAKQSGKPMMVVLRCVP